MNQNKVLMYLQSKYSSKQMFAEKRVEVKNLTALLTQYSKLIESISVDEMEEIYNYKLFLEELRLKQLGSRIQNPIKTQFQTPIQPQFQTPVNQTSVNQTISFNDFPDFPNIDYYIKQNEIAKNNGLYTINKEFIPSKTFTGSKKGYVFKNDSLGQGYYLDKRNNNINNINNINNNNINNINNINNNESIFDDFP